MLDWRIYYENKTTFSNEDGTWEEAPGVGVAAVVTIDPTGVWNRQVLIKHEYYYKVPGKVPLGSEELDLIRVHVPDIQDNQIKRGGNVFREEWQAIVGAATKDPDFPAGTSPRRRVTDFRT